MKKDDCIFCKLANGIIPTNSLYEDDIVNVIFDANPASEGHVLILPKEHFDNIYSLDDKTAAHSGSFQLPHIAASFVLSCFRAFSLRYCHLVFPPTLISLCFCQNISFPAACAVHPSGGRRCPHGSRTGPRSGSCRRSGTAPCSPPGTGSAGAAPAGCRW